MRVLPPLLSALVREPQWLAEHAEAYTDLVACELEAMQAQLTAKAVWWVVAGATGLCGFLFAGVALMLWAVAPHPMPPEQPLWLLIAVPGVMLAVAGFAAWRASNHPRRAAFSELRAQWKEDLALVREGLVR